MANTPKTGTRYTYNADQSKAADPALAELGPNSEVTVHHADKDQVRVGWTDQSGMPREASVKADAFQSSFKEQKG